MSHRRGATGSVTAPQTQSRTDGPVARPEGLETPWLHLEVLDVWDVPNQRPWFLYANGRIRNGGIGWAVDFRRCPFGRAS